MSSHISWRLELDVQPGREDEAKSLLAEIVGSTQANEPGALALEPCLSANEKHCHLYERYADSAAALTHLGNFGDKFAARFMEVLTPVRFVVYGSPDDAVHKALAGFNPVYMKPAGGFRR